MSSTPSLTTRFTLSFTRDLGAQSAVVNLSTERSYEATAGYDLGQVIPLAVGAVDTPITLSNDCFFAALEEVDGEEFLVKVGSTGAQALRVTRLVIEGKLNSHIAIPSGTILYLSNDGSAAVQVRLTWGKKVTP